MSASVIGQGTRMSRYSMESMDSRFRGNDEECARRLLRPVFKHTRTAAVAGFPLPAFARTGFAGMTVVAVTSAMSMASFPLSRE